MRKEFARGDAETRRGCNNLAVVFAISKNSASPRLRVNIFASFTDAQ
jgi:hypothetical protein